MIEILAEACFHQYIHIFSIECISVNFDDIGVIGVALDLDFSDELVDTFFVELRLLE